MPRSSTKAPKKRENRKRTSAVVANHKVFTVNLLTYFKLKRALVNELRLKPYSYRKVIKALGKIGFKVVRQRGSHIILKGFYKDKMRTVVVPKHEEIAIGTLKGILFQAGLTTEEFIKLAEKN